MDSIWDADVRTEQEVETGDVFAESSHALLSKGRIQRLDYSYIVFENGRPAVGSSRAFPKSIPTFRVEPARQLLHIRTRELAAHIYKICMPPPSPAPLGGLRVWTDPAIVPDLSATLSESISDILETCRRIRCCRRHLSPTRLSATASNVSATVRKLSSRVGNTSGTIVSADDTPRTVGGSCEASTTPSKMSAKRPVVLATPIEMSGVSATASLVSGTSPVVQAILMKVSLEFPSLSRNPPIVCSICGEVIEQLEDAEYTSILFYSHRHISNII